MAYVGGPNPNQPLDPSAETAGGQRQRWADRANAQGTCGRRTRID
jgi:hypothetical protein